PGPTRQWQLATDVADPGRNARAARAANSFTRHSWSIAVVPGVALLRKDIKRIIGFMSQQGRRARTCRPVPIREIGSKRLTNSPGGSMHTSAGDTRCQERQCAQVATALPGEPLPLFPCPFVVPSVTIPDGNNLSMRRSPHMLR